MFRLFKDRLKLVFVLGIVFFAGIASAQNVFTVTSTADSDPFNLVAGTLRWAIAQADSSTVPGTIAFNISGTPPIVLTIDSSFGTLPAINNIYAQPITIDGSTQPANDYTGKDPKIVIDGSNLSINDFTLVLSGDGGYIIKNISLQNISRGGIQIESSNNQILNSTFLGVNDKPLSSGSDFVVYIFQTGGSNNIIKNNRIGTDSLSTIFPQSFERDGTSYTINGILLFGGNNTLIKNNQIWNGNDAILTFVPNILITHNLLLATATINEIPLLYPSPDITCLNNKGIIYGTSIPNDTIELFGANNIGEALSYITSTKADNSGNWFASIGNQPWTYITATATESRANVPSDSLPNTSELSSFPNTVSPAPLNFTVSNTISCVGQQQHFNSSLGCTGDSPLGNWNFGNGETATATSNPSTIYYSAGTYTVTFTIPADSSSPAQSVSKTITVANCSNPDSTVTTPPEPPFSCATCIGSFAPEPGKYLVSAWVMEENASPTKLSYTFPQIIIQFPTDTTLTNFSSPALGPFIAQGAIIDGWQRIEAEFVVPVTATSINLKLVSASDSCYFDDIRIFPFDASMKSYVYDPVNLRLVAELDERNYATLYEYDEEGKLIRVKKETENGVMTIKENRNSSVKQ